MPKRLSAPNEIYVSPSAPTDKTMLWIDSDETISTGTGTALDANETTYAFDETINASALITAANARLGTADVVVLGDSSVEGHGADNWMDRLPLAVGNVLGEQGYHMVFGAINTFVSSPVVFTGNAGTVAQNGTEGRGWAGRNAVIRDTTGTITFTFIGDGFDIQYVAYSGGPTVNITVDGGTATPLSTSQATTDRFKIWTGPTLAYGYHTVTITMPSGTVFAYLNGARIYKGDRTSGVRVWDAGHASYTTAAYLAIEDQWGPGITTIQPDLVIISIGGNDLVDAVAPATAAANYKAIVDAIKARCTVAPQIIATLLSRHGSTTLVAWQAMYDAFKAMAATEGWRWIDSTAMLPQPNTYGSLYWTDNTHLSSAGQAVHASVLTHRLLMSPTDSNYIRDDFVRVPHGTNASYPRPIAKSVEWVGSISPTNALDNDTWIQTA